MLMGSSSPYSSDYLPRLHRTPVSPGWLYARL